MRRDAPARAERLTPVRRVRGPAGMVADEERTETPTLDEIRRALTPVGEQGPLGADAAVLVPLYGQGRDLDLLLTRRRKDLSSHPGQISFPGGRREPSDGDLLETALREAREEVGIDADDTTVLGFLTDLRTHRTEPVATYVAHVAGDPPDEPASREEVEEIVVVPLEAFLDPASYESRATGRRRGGYLVHYWHLPQGTVWGLTGRMVARLLVRVLGWSPPGEPRIVEDRDGFRP